MKPVIVGLLCAVAVAGSASVSRADIISIAQASPTVITSGAYRIDADTCCNGFVTISSSAFTDVSLRPTLSPGPVQLPLNVVAGQTWFFTPTATAFAFDVGSFGGTTYRGPQAVTASGEMAFNGGPIVIPSIVSGPGSMGSAVATAPFSMRGFLALYTTGGSELFNGPISGTGTLTTFIQSQLINGSVASEIRSETFTFGSVSATPEPASALLFVTGVLVTGVRELRRRSRSGSAPGRT